MAKGVEIETVDTSAATFVTKRRRILLMEDEDLVRDVAAAMIADLGHEVKSAEDGEKAIELFQQARESGKPFDLLLLDLKVKGGMGGEDTIKKIREIDPDIKAVVSSGYADSTIIADYQKYGFSAFLNKPYTVETLQECLNDLLP